MLKLLFPAARTAFRGGIIQNVVNKPSLSCGRTFASLIPQTVGVLKPNLLQQPQAGFLTETIKRNLIKYSIRKGKRKSVKAVARRFYRLHWGAWIRTICGRQKRLWMKSMKQRQRLKRHVVCNATQSLLLDRMAGKFWTKRRYYVEDPYEPYHTREEFRCTAQKPKPYDPPNGTVPNC